MINKELIQTIWKENKTNFPKTLEEFGEKFIDDKFDDIISFILSLKYLPEKMKLTLTPSPNLGIWIKLRWMNVNVVINQDILSEDLETEIIAEIYYNGETINESDKKSWNDVKEELINLNTTLIEIKKEKIRI